VGGRECGREGGEGGGVVLVGGKSECTYGVLKERGKAWGNNTVTAKEQKYS
jgi:hypothetical protein